MVVESTELGVDSNLEVEPMKTTKTTQDQIHTNGILTLKTKRNINRNNRKDSPLRSKKSANSRHEL